jgi:hypothetical protein
MSRGTFPPPPPGFSLVAPGAPPPPPGFNLVDEEEAPETPAKGPGIVRRTLEAAKGLVESEASYQRRLEAGEVQTSGLGRRWNQLTSAAVLGSPGNVGEALDSPEMNEVVAPMAARMGAPMMTALATTPQGRAVTALNTGMTVAAGYTGDMLAQWMENQQGLREGYSVREAAGNAAAAPVFLARLPVGATLPRAAVQGGVEGTTMVTASALAAGRDLTPEEFLAAGLLGSAFRTVTQAPAREALRKQLYEQAQNLGYQGKGRMADMRRWYEETMEARRVDRMQRVRPEEPVRPVAEIEAPGGPQARAAAPATPPPAAPTPAPPPPPAGFVAVPAAPVAPVARPPAAPAAQGPEPLAVVSGPAGEGVEVRVFSMKVRGEDTGKFSAVMVDGESGQVIGARTNIATAEDAQRIGREMLTGQKALPTNEPTESYLVDAASKQPATEAGDWLSETGIPFRLDKRYPLENVVVNRDVPQFKAKANPKTGVVEALGGQTYIREGTAPIVLWEKLNSETEVITGRHRLAKGREVGEKDLPAYVFREKDGFTKDHAIIFDAESNIRDNQGEVKDYAYYFRNAPLDRGAAEKRGLLRGTKANSGWHLGRDASDDLFTLYANGQIGEAKAVAIARGAPGNPAAQASAMRVARGKTTEELELYASNLNRLAPADNVGSEQLGFAGIAEDFAAFEAEAAKVAAVQAEKLKTNNDLILAAEGAAKRPAAARKMGLPVDDPAALQARIDELRAQNDALTNPSAETFEALRVEAGLPPRPVAPVEPEAPAAPAQVDAAGQLGLLDEDAMGFGLASEVQAAPVAPAPRPADNTPSMFGAEEVTTTAPTKLDQANAAGRNQARGTRSAAELAVMPGRAAEAAPPRPARRNRQAEREAALPAYRADAPLLYQTSKGAYVQVPLNRLDGIPIVRMPELVRLVQTLTGERPDIKKLRRALGLFRPGTGKIALDPRIFQDSVTATKVLAHEIGHFLDWLPHQSLERGNILGHLASLKGYMTSTLPHRPRSPHQALTSEERRKFYAKANNLTTARLGKRPKADGDDADPQGHAAWGVQRSETYRELIEDEIKARKLVKADEVRAELIELSDHWKPYQAQALAGELPQSYIEYRESSKELYADALSVLFNSPATLQEMAPLFYEGFFAYLRNKPEVFKALLSTWELVGGRQKAILDLRDTELRAAARNAEEIWRRKAAEREARGKTGVRGWVDGLRAEVEDIYYPLLKREAAARAAGKPVPVDKSPTVLFEEFALSDNAPYRYLQRLHETVVKPLEEASIAWEDYGLYLIHNRILNERLPLTPEGIGGGRSMVANPGGITPEEARLGLLNWRLNHGLDRYQAMLRADAAMRRLTDEITRDAVKSGVYSAKTYDELIKPNLDNYAAFAVVDYLSESVPASIQVGQGTFKDVANPATATTLKMLSLRRWIQRNDTVRYTTGWMREFAPDEIRPADTKWDPAKRRQVPVEPPRDSGLVLLEEFVDGAKVGHYVPRDVAQMFEDMSPGRLSAIIRPFNWFFREGVYPMWITFNPYFQLFSGPARDLRRNIRNMPGVSGHRMVLEFANNYGTIMGETAAALVRGAGRIPGLGRWRDFYPDLPMSNAVSAVRAHLRGESNPIINEMMEFGALGPPMDNFRSGLFNADDAIQRQMEHIHLLPPSKQRKSLTRGLRSFLYGVEHGGLSFEALAKVATYQILRQRGMPGREVAHFVRNYVGVPNHRKGGRYIREVGSMLPFFNVFQQGLLADAQLAFRGPGKTGSGRPAGADSRTGWWLRYFAESGFWAVLKAMAKLGLLGTGAKVAWDRIGDFDNTNFTTIPLGEVDGGEIDGKKTMYLRVPEDEFSRLLSAFLYKTILTLGGGETQGRNLLAFGAEQVPTINPLITLAEGWGAWLSGYNPRDGFRSSPVLTNDVWLEGGWPALRDMTLWTAQETGAANFFRYDPRANTTLEVGLNSVPGLGRVLKVSDAGLLQAQAEGELDERRDGAVFRNSLPSDVAQLRRSYYWLQRLGREGRSIEQESRYLELTIWKRSVYDPMEAAVLDFGRKRLTREEARWLRDQSLPFREFGN